MRKCLRTYAEQLASSKCKKKYKNKFFAYLYSGGRSVCFCAIKYTVNRFNLVSEAIGFRY